MAYNYNQPKGGLPNYYKTLAGMNQLPPGWAGPTGAEIGPLPAKLPGLMPPGLMPPLSSYGPTGAELGPPGKFPPGFIPPGKAPPMTPPGMAPGQYAPKTPYDPAGILGGIPPNQKGNIPAALANLAGPGWGPAGAIESNDPRVILGDIGFGQDPRLPMSNQGFPQDDLGPYGGMMDMGQHPGLGGPRHRRLPGPYNAIRIAGNQKG